MKETRRMQFYPKNIGSHRKVSGRFPAARSLLARMFMILVLSCFCFALLRAPAVSGSGLGYPHDLLSVSFGSETHGWACGRWGTILHTSDGGKTWTKQNTGSIDLLTSISFVDAKTGWAVGDRGTILHTSDGGKTWVKQKSPVALLLMGVQFLSPLKGWAVGEKTTIIHTDDGGKTWAVQFKDTDFILRGVSFCDEMNGWACGEYGYIFHTTNGGATWTKQAGRYVISDATGEIEADDYLFQITAIDPRTAWAVGIDSIVRRTTDGGATWNKMNVTLPRTHIFAVTHNAGRIIMGGTGLLASGRDNPGNVEPAKVDPPVTYGFIGGVCQRGKAGFAAVGKRGWIYFSNETGTSWHKVDVR